MKKETVYAIMAFSIAVIASAIMWVFILSRAKPQILRVKIEQDAPVRQEKETSNPHIQTI